MLSGNPEHTTELHGVKAVNRMAMGELIAALKESELLVSGGGSLLQNVTSSRSLGYYLSVIWLAKRMKKKVMVYAQGIGPITGLTARTVTAKILNLVDYITVRDFESKSYLEALGVNRPEIRVTADPSFAIQPVSSDEAVEILKASGVKTEMPLIGISMRPWKDQLQWLPSIATGLEVAAKKIGAALVFLPMQLDQDRGLSVQLASQMNVPAAVVAAKLSPSQMLAVVGQMSLVVGMRLHALMFAASMGVPMMGIAYDPKVESFLHVMKQKDILSIDDLTATDLEGRILDVWEHRDIMVKEAVVEVEKLRTAALENADLACSLIGL